MWSLMPCLRDSMHLKLYKQWLYSCPRLIMLERDGLSGLAVPRASNRRALLHIVRDGSDGPAALASVTSCQTVRGKFHRSSRSVARCNNEERGIYFIAYESMSLVHWRFFGTHSIHSLLCLSLAYTSATPPCSYLFLWIRCIISSTSCYSELFDVMEALHQEIESWSMSFYSWEQITSRELSHEDRQPEHVEITLVRDQSRLQQEIVEFQ